jgi:DNA-binding protein H-NS
MLAAAIRRSITGLQKYKNKREKQGKGSEQALQGAVDQKENGTGKQSSSQCRAERQKLSLHDTCNRNVDINHCVNERTQVYVLNNHHRALEIEMARTSSIENMSYAELAQMEARISRMKIERQNAERNELRARIIAMAREHGFEVNELFGRGRKGKGTVAVKYRDPQNPENTWTGRGRMPRWMAAATKGGKAKKEDFLA